MWFIIALLIGAAVAGLMFFLKSRGIKVSWYEWLIGIVGVALLLFTIQNYGASLNEFESGAATTFLLVTGLPSVILLAIAGGLAFMHNRSTA
jgi:uncharacterized membrane protein